MTLTVFRAGNSDVVALNPVLKQKYGIKTGSKIVQEDLGDGISIKPAKSKEKRASKGVKSEFNNWLQDALKEDAGLLEDLA